MSIVFEYVSNCTYQPSRFDESILADDFNYYLKHTFKLIIIKEKRP